MEFAGGGLGSEVLQARRKLVWFSVCVCVSIVYVRSK